MIIHEEDIAAIVVLSIIECIGLAFIIWSILILQRDWYKLYIIKRKNVFTILIGISLATNVLLLPPTEFINHFYNPDDQSTNVVEIFLLPFQLLALWSFVGRAWLYHFDVYLITFNKNKQWRMAIDPINEDSNWYVKNIHKWGNQWYLSKVFILIITVQFIIIIICVYGLKHTQGLILSRTINYIIIDTFFELVQFMYFVKYMDNKWLIILVYIMKLHEHPL